jgi:hypothetical protein
MTGNSNLYMFRSTKAPDLRCFSPSSQGGGLPEKFAPWTALGVLRRDQEPPHGLSRKAIETGVKSNGYQLWRSKKK